MAKRILSLVLFVAFGVAAADAPTLSEHAKNRILKAQLEQSKLQTEANQLQARMNQIQSEWAKAQADLDAAREDAYKESKADKSVWLLDLGKLEYVPVPKPGPSLLEKKP